MDIVVDTSVIVAIILDEPDKEDLIAAASDASLFAPLSLHWEICNALVSGMRRKRFGYETALRALTAYDEIAIRFIDVPLDRSLAAAAENHVYAYDSYFLVCAQALPAPLLTIDRGLARIAESIGIELVEV